MQEKKQPGIGFVMLTLPIPGFVSVVGLAIQDEVYRANEVYRGGLKTDPIQGKHQYHEKKKS